MTMITEESAHSNDSILQLLGALALWYVSNGSLENFYVHIWPRRTASVKIVPETTAARSQVKVMAVPEHS